MSCEISVFSPCGDRHCGCLATAVTLLLPAPGEKFCFAFHIVGRGISAGRYPDQDILNLSLYHAVLELPGKWNAMPVQAYPRKEDRQAAFAGFRIPHGAGARNPRCSAFVSCGGFFRLYARQPSFYEDIPYLNVSAHSRYEIIIKDRIRDMVPASERHQEKCR